MSTVFHTEQCFDMKMFTFYLLKRLTEDDQAHGAHEKRISISFIVRLHLFESLLQCPEGKRQVGIVGHSDNENA